MQTPQVDLLPEEDVDDTHVVQDECCWLNRYVAVVVKLFVGDISTLWNPGLKELPVPIAGTEIVLLGRRM